MSFILKKTGEAEPITTTTTISPFFNLNIGGGSIPSGGFSIFYNSPDSGDNWSLTQSSTSPEFFILSMDFFDKNFGIAGGFSGTIFTTTNGGLNWTRRGVISSPIHPDATNDFNVISVVDGFTMYLFNSPTINSGSNLFKTTNAGNTFTKVGGTLDNKITGIHIFDEDNIVVVADNGYGNEDRLLKSTDGGVTFVGKVSSGETNNNFRDVTFNANRGFAVGTNGTFWESSNFGDSWVDRTGDLPINFNTTINSIYIKFISLDEVIIVGQYAGGIGVLKSINRGTSWVDISSPARSAQLGNGFVTSSDWFDEDNGWILLSNGEVLKTENGGASWSSTLIDLSRNYNSSVNVISVAPKINLSTSETESS